MDGQDSQLSFIRHSDLDRLIAIRVADFQGSLPQRPLPDLLDHPELKHHGRQQHLPSDLFVRIQLWSDNKPLVPSVQTAHKAFKSREQIAWNESVVLPVKYRDLPLNSQLAVTVFDIAGPRKKAVVGGATLRLFGSQATLKKGKQRLFLWKGKEADGSAETETPSKIGLKDEMGRLEKLVKKHERGDIPRLDWLDKLAFRQIEKIHKVCRRLFLPPLASATYTLFSSRPSRKSRRISSSTLTCRALTSPSFSASPYVLFASLCTSATDHQLS
jgi:phosphatidylinositol 3-kinase